MSSRANKKRINRLDGMGLIIKKGHFKGYVFGTYFAQIQQPGTKKWEVATGLAEQIYHLYHGGEYKHSMTIKDFVEKMLPDNTTWTPTSNQPLVLK